MARDDFALTNDTLNGLANDMFYSRLIKLSNNASSYPLPINYLSADAYDTALFNTNVLILAVPANSIGLTAANPRFNYRVETYAAWPGSRRQPHSHLQRRHRRAGFR